MNDLETNALAELLTRGPRTLAQLGAGDEKMGSRAGAALQRLHYAELTTIDGKAGFRITGRGELVAQRIAVEAARRKETV